MEQYSKLTVNILAGKMKGGATYTITATASDPNDPVTIKGEASIIVRTMSKELIPVIKRAPVLTTGRHTLNLLRALNSLPAFKLTPRL